MMNTIDDFRKLKPNPVEIAGYGRESTHKGYLSYILNTDRWSDARAFLARLVGDDAVPTSFNTKWECRIGKRKVDLLVDGDRQIAIELKTDGRVCCDQLNAYKGGKCKVCAFCLGAASVLKHWVDSGPAVFGPKELMAAFDSIDHRPPPVRDWEEAVRREDARRRLAIDFYRLPAETREGAIREGGFRGWKNLYYYVYDHVAESLQNSGLQLRSEPSIHDGGHNAVFSFTEWTAIPRTAKIQYYFEFNDDWYVLKLYSPENRDTRDLVNEIRDAIGHKGETQFPSRNRYRATYITVARWKLLPMFLNPERSDMAGLLQQVTQIETHCRHACTLS